MKEDAIPFYGLSFYFAAVTETVTESAVSNHKPNKAAWFGSLFLSFYNAG